MCLSVYLSPTLPCSPSPEHHDEDIEQLLRGFRRGGCVGTPVVCSRKLRRCHIHQLLFHRDVEIKPFAQIGSQRHKPSGKVFKAAAVRWPCGFL